MASDDFRDRKSDGDGLVAKPEWGTKRTCQNCGARFYDLLRDPIVCPLCQATFDPDRQPRARRTGAAARTEPAAAPRKKAVVEVDDTVDVDAADDEAVDDAEDTEDSGAIEGVESESEDLIEDASELGEDDDDIGEVIEHLDDDMEDKT